MKNRFMHKKLLSQKNLFANVKSSSNEKLNLPRVKQIAVFDSKSCETRKKVVNSTVYWSIVACKL